MSNAIRLASEVMRDALKSDEGFRNGYIANIAMLLHDRYGITDYETRSVGHP